MSYQAALQLLVETLEGGYVLSDLPGDPGGRTYSGITEVMWIRTTNRSFDAGLPDRCAVANWYQDNFWAPAHCADLPEPADSVMLQLAVNIGAPKTYISLLQCAIGARPVDGIWGARTLTASQVIARDEFPWLLLAVQDAYYRFAASWTYRDGLLGRTMKVRDWLKRLPE